MPNLGRESSDLSSETEVVLDAVGWLICLLFVMLAGNLTLGSNCLHRCRKILSATQATTGVSPYSLRFTRQVLYQLEANELAASS